MVADRVRLEPSSAFTSAPMRTLYALGSWKGLPGCVGRTYEARPTAYGISSHPPGLRPIPSPARCPKRTGPPLSLFPQNDQTLLVAGDLHPPGLQRVAAELELRPGDAQLRRPPQRVDARGRLPHRVPG